MLSFALNTVWYIPEEASNRIASISLHSVFFRSSSKPLEALTWIDGIGAVCAARDLAAVLAMAERLAIHLIIVESRTAGINAP